VAIAAGATVDVDTTAAAVTVHLHAGTLRAHVVHRERATWRFGAGPFDVTVTGTRFETGWDEARREFTLSLTEGGVVVSGPLLGAAGQIVRTGETLRVSVADGGVSWERSPALEAPPPATPPAPAPEPAAPSPTPAPGPSPARPTTPVKALLSRPTPPAPDWRELARTEHHDEAVQAAVAEGYPAVLQTANAADLLLLADAARFAREPDRARAALAALRARFPGSTQAATALFGLGRLAFDADLRAAATDFQAYLDEAPNGALAREAAGRLLEARARLPEHDAAAAAAAEYLRRFPDGPRADLARSLMP
jgi:transmembrane sensor